MKTAKAGLKCSLAALTCMLSVGFVLPTAEPVRAEKRVAFLDLLFNPQARRQRAYRLEQERLRELQSAAPVVKISAPQVYTYKPDRVSRVDLSPLAHIEIASADPFAGPPLISRFDRSRRFLDGFGVSTVKEVGQALIDYYTVNHDFIWVDGLDANDRARAALATMNRADEVGLSPADYRLELPPDGFDRADIAERRRALIQFEMQMSAKALAYVLDATRGRIDPNRLSGYHDFERKKIDLVAALGNLAAAPDVGVYLAGSNPQNRQFEVLTETLAALRAAESADRIVIAEGTFLRPGTSNPELGNVVAAIRKRGSDSLLLEHGLTLYAYEADGGDLYTPDLVALVKQFQRENDLAADGIVGPMTIAKLTDLSNAEKVGKIVLAMERLRWLPRDLGQRYVFINQPAYRATYVEDGESALSMRAVVGKRSNQTSFFQDEIETVEYNPYWGVPGSIIVNEMLPELRRDPSYLDRLGYEVTDRQGRMVSSTQVDWFSVGTDIPVDVRQPPGKKNALGELKIMFPNEHAIYMHDTPAKELFGRDSRAFSHGCVRLQDPRGMAAAVLGSSRDHIAAQIAKGENFAEPVSGRIPVYVSYFTAWPRDDGTVGYYGDMYGRDKRLDMAIDATEKVRTVSG